MLLDNTLRLRLLYALAILGTILNDDTILIVEARSHNYHLHLILVEIWLDTHTPDDIGIDNIAILVLVLGVVLHTVAHTMRLVERQAIRTRHRDIYQHIARAADRGVAKEWRGENLIDNLLGTILSRLGCNAHDSTAATSHHCTHIGKIDIHKVRLVGDNLGNTLCCKCHNIVGTLERLLHRQITIKLVDGVVAQNDYRIDIFAQLLDTHRSLSTTVWAVIAWRCGYDSDGQDIHFVRQLGNHGSCSRTGASTHTCRQKEHLGTSGTQQIAHLIERHHSLLGTNFGIIARSKTVFTQKHSVLLGNVQLIQVVLVGVAGSEVYALNLHLPHVLDSVATGTANTHRHNARRLTLHRDKIVQYAVIFHTLFSLLFSLTHSG